MRARARVCVREKFLLPTLKYKSHTLAKRNNKQKKYKQITKTDMTIYLYYVV